MDETATSATGATEPGIAGHSPVSEEVREHVVEILSDSGEGAQSAGQMFGTVSAKMGNGVWTRGDHPGRDRAAPPLALRSQRQPHPSSAPRR